MKRGFLRIVAALLVPCLLVDTAVAGGWQSFAVLEKSSDFSTVENTLFNEQALMERAVNFFIDRPVRPMIEESLEAARRLRFPIEVGLMQPADGAGFGGKVPVARWAGVFASAPVPAKSGGRPAPQRRLPIQGIDLRFTRKFLETIKAMTPHQQARVSNRFYAILKGLESHASSNGRMPGKAFTGRLRKRSEFQWFHGDRPVFRFNPARERREFIFVHYLDRALNAQSHDAFDMEVLSAEQDILDPVVKEDEIAFDWLKEWLYQVPSEGLVSDQDLRDLRSVLFPGLFNPIRDASERGDLMEAVSEIDRELHQAASQQQGRGFDLGLVEMQQILDEADGDTRLSAQAWAGRVSHAAEELLDQWKSARQELLKLIHRELEKDDPDFIAIGYVYYDLASPALQREIQSRIEAWTTRRWPQPGSQESLRTAWNVLRDPSLASADFEGMVFECPVLETLKEQAYAAVADALVRDSGRSSVIAGQSRDPTETRAGGPAWRGYAWQLRAPRVPRIRRTVAPWSVRWARLKRSLVRWGRRLAWTTLGFSIVGGFLWFEAWRAGGPPQTVSFDAPAAAYSKHRHPSKLPMDLGLSYLTARTTSDLSEYRGTIVRNQKSFQADYVFDMDAATTLLEIPPDIFVQVISDFLANGTSAYQSITASLDVELTPRSAGDLVRGTLLTNDPVKKCMPVLNGRLMATAGKYALDRFQDAKDADMHGKKPEAGPLRNLGRQARGIERSLFAEAARKRQWIARHPDLFVYMTLLEDHLRRLAGNAGYSDREMDDYFYPYLALRVDYESQAKADAELYRRFWGNTSSSTRDLRHALQQKMPDTSDAWDHLEQMSLLRGQVPLHVLHEIIVRSLVAHDHPEEMSPFAGVIDLGLSCMRARNLVKLVGGRYQSVNPGEQSGLEKILTNPKYLKLPDRAALQELVQSRPTPNSKGSYWKPVITDDPTTQLRDLPAFTAEFKLLEDDTLEGREPMLHWRAPGQLMEATQVMNAISSKGGLSPIGSLLFMSSQHTEMFDPVNGLSLDPAVGVHLTSRKIILATDLAGPLATRIQELKRQGEIHRALVLQTVFRASLLQPVVDFDEAERRLSDFVIFDELSSTVLSAHSDPGYPAGIVGTVLVPAMRTYIAAHERSWEAVKGYLEARRPTLADLEQAGHDLGDDPKFSRTLSGLMRIMKASSPGQFRVAIALNLADSTALARSPHALSKEELTYPLSILTADQFFRVHRNDIVIHDGQIEVINEENLDKDLRSLDVAVPPGMAPGQKPGAASTEPNGSRGFPARAA